MKRHDTSVERRNKVRSLQGARWNGKGQPMVLDDGLAHDFEMQLLIEQSKNEAIRVRLATVCDIARDLVNSRPSIRRRGWCGQ